jgi:hypothetical protein
MVYQLGFFRETDLQNASVCLSIYYKALAHAIRETEGPQDLHLQDLSPRRVEFLSLRKRTANGISPS